MFTILFFVMGIAAMTISLVLVTRTVRSISTFSYLFSGKDWGHRLTIFIAAFIFGILAAVIFFSGIASLDSSISAQVLLQNILIIMMVVYLTAYVITASNSPYPKYHY